MTNALATACTRFEENIVFMNKLYAIALIAGSLSFSSTVNAQDPVATEVADKLQFTLDSAITALKITGVSVNVTTSDGKVWNSVGGYSDASTQTPMNPDHLLWTASMCKEFTGGLVMQLVQEGKVTLEDKIGMYFNDIPNVDTNVTLREMLKHRSGIAEFLSNASSSQWYTNPDKVWTSREALETYLPAKTFAHGMGFEYSNSNYLLLGMVIEKVTGRTLAEELRTRFFTPLGLTHTYFMPNDFPIEEVTPCWSDFNQDGVFDDQANFIHSTCFASMVAGAGAMLSKPDEISKFTRALHGGQLINANLLNEMKVCSNVSFGPNSTGYGISTMRYNFFGKNYYGHGGDISGFTTLTIHQPETNVTLTLMINQDRQNRAALAAALLKKLSLITTGISENELDSKVTLLENPVSDVLNVSLATEIKSCSATIYSLDGRQLSTHELEAGLNKINTSLLPSGMYQLVLTTGLGPVSKRFVKH